MSSNSTLLKGTFILTFSSLFSRILGFIYRIFISRFFPTEEIGLYQLIFPVYALGFSLASAGLQSALSRCTARYCAQNQKHKAVLSLKSALCFSVILSFIFLLIVQNNLHDIASNFLGDVRCSPLLLIAIYALPFAAIHNGICGYYIGQKSTKTIAISQLIEQVSRISFIILCCLYFSNQKQPLSISLAAIGLIVGEVFACIYTMYQCRKELFFQSTDKANLPTTALALAAQAVPLTSNRVLINLMQSIEAVSIPLRLHMYGLATSDALSLYGIFTGMALPCILFPSAFTNSLSSMLLPTIAEYQVSRKRQDLWNYICKIAASCFLLGTGCFLFFFLIGPFIGNVLFNNVQAGIFIKLLSFICPFLYMNTTLLSTLNGLGCTLSTFFINMFSLGLRIVSVYFLVPYFGIESYMLGLLTSQILISLLSLFRIHQILS